MPDMNNLDKVDDSFDGLSDKDRKETEEINKEIAGDTQADTPKEEPPKEEPKKPEPKEEPKEPKAEEAKKEEKKEEKKLEEQSRKVKLIPAEVHYTARDKWEKEKKDLETKLAEAARGSAKEQDGDKPKADVDADLRKQTDAIAEKYGTDPEEEFEKAKAYRTIFGKGETPKLEIPKEITEGIEDIKTLKQEKLVEAEETRFNSDFDSTILPLIKAEYGDDVPKSVVADVKEKVKGTAYKEEFAKVPLSMIYKGGDEFRDLVAAKQQGSEKSRGGYSKTVEATKTDEIDLAVEQPDSVISKMTDAQFDTYSTNMQKREKK